MTSLSLWLIEMSYSNLRKECIGTESSTAACSPYDDDDGLRLVLVGEEIGHHAF